MSLDPIRGFDEPAQKFNAEQGYRFGVHKRKERFKLCHPARSVIYPELMMKQNKSAEHELTQLLSFRLTQLPRIIFVNDTDETYPLLEEAPHPNTVFYRIGILSVEELLE